MLAGRRLISPVPERVRVEAVLGPEMPIAVPHSIVVDPQVMPRHLRIAPRRSRLAVAAFLCWGVALPARGQSIEQDPVNQSATPREPGSVERQQQLIDDLARRIEQLQRQLDELRAQVERPRETPQAVAPTQVEEPKAEKPDIPADAVTFGEFPGSFKIPGTDAAVKIGGLVRVNWVSTLDPLLVTDKFVTAAIPVDVTGAPVGARVDVMAIPSRFNLDFRTPTGAGYVRAFIEADFSGSGNTFSLRHAYGQWRRLLFGQTWSTFADPEAIPDGIDFEGLNAAVHFRQPQVRWTWRAGPRFRVALALENADTELTGLTAANDNPDFVSRLRWQPDRGGHLQVAALVRQLRGFPSNAPADLVTARGWGVQFSGDVPVPLLDARDQLLFQVKRGDGIGHYINDLNAEGGQDGVFDAAANVIRVLSARAGYVSYEHWWSEVLHSATTVGLVGVTTLDIQPPSAYRLTQRYSSNMIWSPIPRLELVAEFLYGVRVNADQHRLRARQIQIGSTFRF